MTTKNQNSNVELKIDAEHQVEWFKKHYPTHSTEEVLLDMAKYLVQIETRYKKQENFFSAVFGSIILGSIFMAALSLVSREWNDLFLSVFIFIASMSVLIFLYGKRRK